MRSRPGLSLQGASKPEPAPSTALCALASRSSRWGSGRSCQTTPTWTSTSSRRRRRWRLHGRRRARPISVGPALPVGRSRPLAWKPIRGGWPPQTAWLLPPLLAPRFLWTSTQLFSHVAAQHLSMLRAPSRSSRWTARVRRTPWMLQASIRLLWLICGVCSASSSAHRVLRLPLRLALRVRRILAFRPSLHRAHQEWAMPRHRQLVASFLETLVCLVSTHP